MDIHLEKECSIVTGKAASKSMPVCSRASCKKPLILPIACDVRTALAFIDNHPLSTASCRNAASSSAQPIDSQETIAALPKLKRRSPAAVLHLGLTYSPDWKILVRKPQQHLNPILSRLLGERSLPPVHRRLNLL